MNFASASDAAKVLVNGGIVAYPTESCFGIGCNPLDRDAVSRILNIKRRGLNKGLILIADHYARFANYIDFVPPENNSVIISSWPGPFTWLLPARNSVPRWVRGSHSFVALRVTAHGIARELCAQSGMAIVSTSANQSGRSPARTAEAVNNTFGGLLDCIVGGRIGNSKNPSTIRNAITGDFIR